MESFDPFGIWLSNINLLNSMNDEAIQSNILKIVAALGGVVNMIKICLANQDNMNLTQQRQLFNCLSDVKETSKKIQIDASPSNLVSINDISISSIFTFLNKKDHFNLQKTSIKLSIVGRKRESFVIDPVTRNYVNFGHHLELVHKLPNCMQLISSNNITQQQKAINTINMLSHGRNRAKKISIIEKSGFIGHLAIICKSKPILLFSVLNVMHELDDNSSFLKNHWESIWESIRQYLTNDTEPFADVSIFDDFYIFIESIMDDYSLGKYKCIAIAKLNEINVLRFLVDNILKCHPYKIHTFLYFINDFITHSSFQTMHSLESLRKLNNSVLFQSVAIVAQDEMRLITENKQKLPQTYNVYFAWMVGRSYFVSQNQSKTVI
eukprot:186917_1